MNVNFEATTAVLAAQGLQKFVIDRNVKFGVIARDLPTIDPVTLVSELMPVLMADKLRLALIGYDNENIPQHPALVVTIEDAVSLRNSPDMKVPLVVIVNPRRLPEKIHSLEMLEPFTDQHLVQSVCLAGEKMTPAPGQDLWKALRRRDVMRLVAPVATQMINFYINVRDAIPVGEALSSLGLLPDTKIFSFLSDKKSLIKRLSLNRKYLQQLLALDKKENRALVRALNPRIPGLRSTFIDVQNYIRQPSSETLARLSLDPVSYTHLTLPTNREV